MKLLYIQDSFYSLGGRVEALQAPQRENRSRHPIVSPNASTLLLSKKKKHLADEFINLSKEEEDLAHKLITV